MTSFLTSRRLRGGLTGVAVAAMVLTTAACGGTTRGEDEGSGSAGESENSIVSPPTSAYRFWRGLPSTRTRPESGR